jgi:Carboxypeptidase regulatory-like domain
MLGKTGLARGFAVTFLLVAFAGLISPAQFDERDVSGLVVDKSGQALRGAVVQLENSASMGVRSWITGADGRYYFGRLDEDIDYTLQARYHRFRSPTKRLSKFSSTVHADVILAVPVD